MFSLDSCKLPLPSLPNTDCKKNNRLDRSHPIHLQISEFPVPSNTSKFRGFRTLLALAGKKYIFSYSFRPPPPYMVWKEDKKSCNVCIAQLPMTWCEIELLGIFICEKIAPTCLSMELVDSIHSPVNKIAPFPPPLSLLQPDSS